MAEKGDRIIIAATVFWLNVPKHEAIFCVIQILLGRLLRKFYTGRAHVRTAVR